MSEERTERRLTAILAADVVGYSRLMAVDEAGTLAALKAHRRDLIGPKTAEYGGRVVKLMGDGTLMEFASVVDAVNFAVDVQRTMTEGGAEVPEDRRIAYRVGINIGDIIVEGDDIYGDGVNIAARLEGLAEPGGICVAQNVFNQVKAKVDVTFEDLGERQLKNIPEPLRIYRVILPSSEAETSGGQAPRPAGPVNLTPPDKPSIAVLPFENMSGDPEQDYFADGIVEDLITELSREPDLFVIARNSSFAYKGRSLDIRRIAGELGVRYVLEGSVRRAGNRVRLNAQLIEAESNRHVWAERYDRALEDVFEVQDELTNAINNTLLQKFRQIGFERSLHRAPRDMNAYDHVQRAFGLLLRINRTDNEAARREAEAALALDPDYARAHMILAWVHLYSVFLAQADDPAHALELSRQAAGKAVAANKDDFWSHAALGGAELFLGHHERALSALEHAVALSPNNADARGMRAVVLNFLGRPEEALADMEFAMRLNPHHPDWYLVAMGRAHYLLGRHEAALPYLERLLDSDPEFVAGRLLLAANTMALGRAEAARGVVARLLELKPGFTLAEVPLIVPFRNQEDLERYLDLLRQAGLPE